MNQSTIREALRPGHRRAGERPTGPALEDAERRALLACARATLAAATGLRSPSYLGEALDATSGLDRPARAFVTLTTDGRLRGCMGCLDPGRSMRESVVTATIRATLEDPRFPPVTERELPGLRIAISVLGPDRPFVSAAAFRPGVDGVIVERGFLGALMLPEVATEFGWDAEDMLAAVCRKAGLATDAWTRRGTRVVTFETVRFDGPALEAPSWHHAEARTLR